MTRKIPTAVIAVVSDALANRHTHAAIDQMMEAAGLELNPSPGGDKQVKTRGWFTYANNTSSDPLGTLGTVVAEFMQKDSDEWDKSLHSDQERASVKRWAITACRMCKAATFSLSAQQLLATHCETSSAHATCLVCKPNSAAFTRT
jgi:hypothetical protein